VDRSSANTVGSDFDIHARHIGSLDSNFLDSLFVGAEDSDCCCITKTVPSNYFDF
jgi:hypothetical protein